MKTAIIITHFVNPSLFWYFRYADENNNALILEELEDLLQQNLLNTALPKTSCSELWLKVGDDVAAYYVPWRRYIRAKVARVDNSSDGFVYWARDHGFPFRSESKHVRKLPFLFETKEVSSNLLCGAIANVMPAEAHFDSDKSSMTVLPRKDWCPYTIISMNDLLDSATLLVFDEISQLENGQHIGNLTVCRTRLPAMSADEFLIHCNYAIPAEGNGIVTERSFIENPWLALGEYFTNVASSIRKHDTNVTQRTYSVEKVGDWCSNHFSRQTYEDTSSMDDSSHKENVPKKISILARRLQAVRRNDTIRLAIDDNSANNDSHKSAEMSAVPTTTPEYDNDDAEFLTKLNAECERLFGAGRNKTTTSSYTSHYVNCSTDFSRNTSSAENLNTSSLLLESQSEQNSNHARGSKQHQTIHSKVKSSPKASIVPEQQIDKQNKVLDVKSNTTSECLKDEPARRHHVNTAVLFAKVAIDDEHWGDNKPIQMPNINWEDIRRTSPRQIEGKNVTVVPAGFDLSRLVTYRDKNHWHCRESTRNDKSPGGEISPLFGRNHSKGNNPNTTDYDIDANGHIKDTLSADRSEKLDDSNEIPQSGRYSTLRGRRYASGNSLQLADGDVGASDHIEDMLAERQSGERDDYFNDSSYNVIVVKDRPKRRPLTAPDKQLDKLDEIIKRNQFEIDNGINDNAFIYSTSALSISRPLTKNSSSSKELPHSALTGSNLIQNEAVDHCEPKKLLKNADIAANTIRAYTKSLELKKLEQLQQNKEATTNLKLLDEKSAIYSERKNLPNSLNAQSNESVNSSSIRTPAVQTVELKNQQPNAKDSTTVDNASTSPSTNRSILADNMPAVFKRYFEQLGSADRDTKNVKEIYLPHAEQMRTVEGERELVSNYKENLVLVHSEMPITPYALERSVDSPLMSQIYNEMTKLKFTKIFRVQAYAWRHLFRGNSVFVVNPPKSGKSWCYIPTICNSVALKLQKPITPNTFGPIAVITCACTSDAEMVYSFCQCLVCNVGSKVMIRRLHTRNYATTKVECMDASNCSILITTPSMMLSLLKDNAREPLLHPQRLRHFVIDDIDKMLERSPRITECLQLLKKLFSHADHQTLNMQLVVTSSKWDSRIERLIKLADYPLLLIGDFLQATVYGRVPIHIRIGDASEKMHTMYNYISKLTLASERVLVVCGDDSEVQQVAKSLTGLGVLALGYHNTANLSQQQMAQDWAECKLGTDQLLVCSDDTFPDLKIQKATHLIHYSLPATWTFFKQRFSSLVQNISNRVQQQNNTDHGNGSSNQKSTPHSLVLMDASTLIYLPRLVEFLQQLKQRIPTEILEIVERVKCEREWDKLQKNLPLCEILLEFGECTARCKYRHRLAESDVFGKTFLPASGAIRVTIQKVLSPLHYAVNLYQYYSAESKKWKNMKTQTEYSNLAINLNMHYMSEKNLVTYWPLNVDEMCVYKYGDIFVRARILSISKKLAHTNLVQVIPVAIKLIDMGNMLPNVKSDQLFVCDEQFVDVPPQVNDLYLTGVVPFERELDWDIETNATIEKWLVKKHSNKIVEVTIDFTLGNKIWGTNMYIMDKLKSDLSYVSRAKLKDFLLKKNIVTVDTRPKHVLRQMAKDLGIFELQNTMPNPQTGDTNQTPACKEEYLASDTDSGDCVNNENDDNSQSSLCASQNVISSEAAKQHLSNEQTAVLKNIETHTHFKETWISVPLSKLVKVEIGDEDYNGKWRNIYLQVIDDVAMEEFKKLIALIESYIERVKLEQKSPRIFDKSWFNMGRPCIVKYNGLYLRAKVYDSIGTTNCESYRFFLCDYACCVIRQAKDLYDDFLYDTTAEIVECTPYQAVHCTLAGVVIDSLTKCYKVTKDYLYIYAVRKENDMQNCWLNSYKTLLYECEKENDFSTASMVNKALLETNTVLPDSATIHFLELELNLPVDALITEENNTDTKASDDDIQANLLDDQMELNMLSEMLKKFSNSETQHKDGSSISERRKLDILRKETEEMYELFVDSKKISKMVASEELVTCNVSNATATEQNVQETNEVSHDATSNDDLLNTSNSSMPPLVTPEQYANQVLHDATSNDESLNTSYSSMPPLVTAEEYAYQVSLANGDLLNTADSLLPPMVNPPKPPSVLWHETTRCIYLAIHAPNVDKYHLNVTKDQLYFFARDSVGEVLSMKLVFCFPIEPEYMVYEKRGLDIHVELRKVFFCLWQQLLKNRAEYRWLIHNHDAENSNENNYMSAQQRLAVCDHILKMNSTTKKPVSDDDSTEDSDTNDGDFNDPLTDNFSKQKFSATYAEKDSDNDV